MLEEWLTVQTQDYTVCACQYQGKILYSVVSLESSYLYVFLEEKKRSMCRQLLAGALYADGISGIIYCKLPEKETKRLSVNLGHLIIS